MQGFIGVPTLLCWVIRVTGEGKFLDCFKGRGKRNGGMGRIDPGNWELAGQKYLCEICARRGGDEVIYCHLSTLDDEMVERWHCTETSPTGLADG